MTIATGVNKSIIYKAETTWGTLAGTGSGKVLRRVTSAFNLQKETYESNEIRTDYQVQDYRHGVRSVAGTLSGELSPGTYADFFAAALAKDFAAVTSLTGLSITVAGTGPYTLTRASGSFITDGLKIGDVIRLTAGSFAVANLNKNLLVTNVVALVATVVVVNGSTMTAEGPVASATIAWPGKKTLAPLTGHTDKSFTVEEFYSDVAQSEVYTGNKVNTVSMSLPASGLVTCEFGFMGKTLDTTGTSQYFVSPTAQGTTGIFAAVNGILLVNGTAIALLTNLNININRNMQNATVVGSNSVVEMFEGRIQVEGDFSAYFENANFRDYFKDETEVALVVVLTTANTAASDFMTISLPRIKVNSNTRDDGETGISAQHSFKALLNSAGASNTDVTTIAIQDSQA